VHGAASHATQGPETVPHSQSKRVPAQPLEGKVLPVTRSADLRGYPRASRRVFSARDDVRSYRRARTRPAPNIPPEVLRETTPVRSKAYPFAPILHARRVSHFDHHWGTLRCSRGRLPNDEPSPGRQRIVVHAL